MDPVRLMLCTIVAILAGCTTTHEMPATRSYDLSFAHPSPHANYIQVTPGHPGAALPAPQDILTPAFSLYLRQSTGCVYDSARRASVIGNLSVPAGFMVPVDCP